MPCAVPRCTSSMLPLGCCCPPWCPATTAGHRRPCSVGAGRQATQRPTHTGHCWHSVPPTWLQRRTAGWLRWLAAGTAACGDCLCGGMRLSRAGGAVGWLQGFFRPHALCNWTELTIAVAAAHSCTFWAALRPRTLPPFAALEKVTAAHSTQTGRAIPRLLPHICASAAAALALLFSLPWSTPFQRRRSVPAQEHLQSDRR